MIDLEDRLRRTLDAVAEQTPIVEDLDAVLSRTSRRRRVRWVAPALVAALVAIVVGTVAVLGGDDEPARVDVAGPAAPVRVILGDGAGDLRLVEATTETEMGVGGAGGQLWVYAPDDAEVPVADRVVAVAVSSEKSADFSDLAVKDPTPISIAGRSATIADEPDGGWVISWPKRSADGSIIVVGRGLTRADLVAYAATVNDAGPTSPPTGFRLVFDGADPSYGDRKGVGATYESPDGKRLEVVVIEWRGFDPAAFIWRPFGAGASRITNVRGHQGMLIDVEEGSDSLTWLERDDYVVHLSGDAVDPDGLVRIAEGLREVSEETWLEHIADLVPPEDEGGTTTTVSGGVSTTVAVDAAGDGAEFEIEGYTVRAKLGDLDGEQVLCFHIDGVVTPFCPPVATLRGLPTTMVEVDPAHALLLGTANAQGDPARVDIVRDSEPEIDGVLGPELTALKVHPFAVVVFDGVAGELEIVDDSGQALQAKPIEVGSGSLRQP